MLQSRPTRPPQSRPKKCAPRSVRSPELPKRARRARPAMNGVKTRSGDCLFLKYEWACRAVCMPMIPKTAVEKPTKTWPLPWSITLTRLPRNPLSRVKKNARPLPVLLQRKCRRIPPIMQLPVRWTISAWRVNGVISLNQWNWCKISSEFPAPVSNQFECASQGPVIR